MDKQKLIETLAVQSVSGNDKLMVEFITKELIEIGCEFYHNEQDGNIYVSKGESDSFPCVVAHMDTVHKIVEDLYVLQVGHKLTGFNRIKMEQTGIGGDDKVGIFIALECLRLFDNIKAVFFCDEEVGCFGSYEADMEFFDDCGFVLQCDRKGNKDFIHNADGTPLSSKPFRKAANKIMKDFGYKFEHGMMTDVMALKENGLKCSCANMSCGYYNPHSYNEYVDMKDVENCLDMVKQMIATMGGIDFPHTYKPVYKYDKLTAQSGFMQELNYNTANVAQQGILSRSYWGGYGDRWDDETFTPKEKTVCQACLCQKENVQWNSYFNTDLCDDCIEEYHQLYDKKII